MSPNLKETMKYGRRVLYTVTEFSDSFDDSDEESNKETKWNRVLFQEV